MRKIIVLGVLSLFCVNVSAMDPEPWKEGDNKLQVVGTGVGRRNAVDPEALLSALGGISRRRSLDPAYTSKKEGDGRTSRPNSATAGLGVYVTLGGVDASSDDDYEYDLGGDTGSYQEELAQLKSEGLAALLKQIEQEQDPSRKKELLRRLEGVRQPEYTVESKAVSRGLISLPLLTVAEKRDAIRRPSYDNTNAPDSGSSGGVEGANTPERGMRRRTSSATELLKKKLREAVLAEMRAEKEAEALDSDQVKVELAGSVDGSEDSYSSTPEYSSNE